jgi:hypothetical protein
MYAWLRIEAPRNYDEEIDKAYHEGEEQGQPGQQNQSGRPGQEGKQGPEPQPA